MKILLKILTRCGILFEILTRCKIFNSKSAFQNLAESLSKFYRHQRTICWMMTMACGKKIFLSVWHVFVSRLVLPFWLLLSLCRLGS